MNDINDWLAEKNGKSNEIVDDMCGEEEETDSNPSEKCLEVEQQSEKLEDNVNQQQRCGSKKQLTQNRNVHDIDSYKEIVYVNKDGVLEEIFDYLDRKKDKNTKKIWWSSEHQVATGRQ